MRLLLLASFVTFACDSDHVSVRARQLSDLSAPDHERLSRQLQRSQVVFVGSLDKVDTGWAGYTGSLAIATRPMRFEVEIVIKGEVGSVANVEYVFFEKGEWVEEKAEKGLRLSPQFFRVGSRYIVLATLRDSLIGGVGKQLYVDGDRSEGIWLATPENQAEVRRLLKR